MPSKDYVYKTFGENEECVATVHYNDTDKSSKAIGMHSLRTHALEPEPYQTHDFIAIASHGGAWCAGWKELIPSGQIEWLIKNGFVVVAYNYRLCPNVSLMEGPIGDTRVVYHWSRNTLPRLMKRDTGLDVDGERIVALGGSAGGTLAMVLVCISFRAGIITSFMN